MNYILVVIYNKKCINSRSIKCIIDNSYYKYQQVIIFDNSETDFGNQSFCEKYGFVYYWFCENWGLSKAYNYVIHHLTNDGYLTILDDDTLITEDYFKEAKFLVETKEFDIILPVVKAGEAIISPCNTKYKSGSKIINDICDIDFRKISAINSGMIVKRTVYDSFTYNEDLFLDCVDHDFMLSVRNAGLKIKIMECTIEQNYSRKEKGSIHGAIIRFLIYKRDFKIYAERAGNLFFYYLSMLKLAFDNVIKYKNPVFLKLLILDCNSSSYSVKKKSLD